MACMYCGKDFLNMNLMYHHINTDHSGIFVPQNSTYSNSKDASPKLKTYPCDLCTMKFETSSALKDHLENIHWKLNVDYNATTSQQAKATDLSRKRKIDDVDDKRNDATKRNSPSAAGSPYDANDKPCICSYCYAQMPNFKSFLVHMESHVSLSASNFVGYCPICGEPGRDPIEFSSHIFSHIVSDVTGRCCHQCKKSFDQLEQLQKHNFEVHSQSLDRKSVV